jgi:hypothetical protein
MKPFAYSKNVCKPKNTYNQQTDENLIRLTFHEAFDCERVTEITAIYFAKKVNDFLKSPRGQQK